MSSIQVGLLEILGHTIQLILLSHLLLIKEDHLGLKSLALFLEVLQLLSLFLNLHFVRLGFCMSFGKGRAKDESPSSSRLTERLSLQDEPCG